MAKDPVETIRRIAMVLGHELRNPLAAINNSAYYLKAKLSAEGRLDPKLEKHLGIVASEIARMDRMIADILSFSRALEVRPVPMSLNACLRETLEGCEFSESLRVEKELSNEDPRVSLDAAVFADALRRIFDNAVEAMPDGGALKVRTAAEREEIRLEIEDAGPGIKPEVLGMIFEPFFTTKSRGLGLGLTLARKAVLAHGARLEAENLHGGGAVFRIVWPGGGARES